ncbi:MAG: hypothetical protein L0H31_09480 [Nocardioidaceae bacterium]|nr:hypothetical protein [Nocardioidaceae bacterium]
MTGTRAQRGLSSPRIRPPSFTSRRWRWGLGALALMILGAWFAWYASTPEPLPRTDDTVNASGVAGKPSYLGMFVANNGFDRTIRIAGVKVHATTSAKFTITPLLCRQGAIGVTTDPTQFCEDIVDTEGERMSTGDSLILKVESREAAIAVIDQIHISYREDLSWDTQPAGARQAIVTMAGRSADPSAP